MSGLLATDIMNDAALLLNDSAKTTFTYAAQTPWLKKALDAFSDELAVNNIQFLEKRTVIAPTIVGTTTTIPLPVDALYPNTLEERAYGSSDAWIGMYERENISPNLTSENSFGIWAFQGTLLNSAPVIDVPNATSAREVRITYTRFISTVGVDSTTDFSTALTFQSKRYISAKIAEYITRFVLQNDKRGKELKEESEQARYRIIQIWTKRKQGQPIRKSKYGSPVQTSLSYPTGNTGGSPATTPAIVTAPYDYYVKDRGAVGDGLTDDTLAIQATINAALLTGGRVIFDPKTYLVSSSLSIPLAGASSKPVFLVGYGKYNNLQVAGIAGTTIKWIGTSAAGIVISIIGRNSCGIDGISIDCGLTTGSIIAADVGLYIESCIDCTFKSVNVYRAAQWGFKLRANAAGVYRCRFIDLTTDLSCNGGMLHESLNVAADIAQCTFDRVDIVYSGPNAGMDLKATDNCIFIGIVVIASNGATCGPLINIRDVSAPNFGCLHNLFLGLDGGTTSGAQKGILCNASLPNMCYGLDFANGLIIDTASTEADKFVWSDLTGIVQSNLFRITEGRPFGTPGETPFEVYYDITAAKVRFQNHDPATKRGWIFSGNAGVAAEVVAFEIDPDGHLFRAGETTALGRWVTPSYDATRFTASAGVWNTAAGTSKYQYSLFDGTAKIKVNISGSGPSAIASLKIALPPGKTVGGAAGEQQYGPIRVVDNGAVAAWGLWLATPGDAFVNIFSSVAAGSFAISAGNTTSVQGSMEIAIN